MMYDRNILNFNLRTQRLGSNSMTFLSYQGLDYQLDHHWLTEYEANFGTKNIILKKIFFFTIYIYII